jgi:hypothetical protein
MRQKTLSPYGARNKKNFRILGNDQKNLRAFDEQLFYTVVLDTRFLETKVDSLDIAPTSHGGGSLYLFTGPACPPTCPKTDGN